MQLLVKLCVVLHLKIMLNSYCKRLFNCNLKCICNEFFVIEIFVLIKSLVFSDHFGTTYVRKYEVEAGEKLRKLRKNSVFLPENCRRTGTEITQGRDVCEVTSCCVERETPLQIDNNTALLKCPTAKATAL